MIEKLRALNQDWADELADRLKPHLVTEKDFDNADRYGYLPVWTQTRRDLYCECITKYALENTDERYWSSKPAEKDINTPWA